MIGAFKIAAMAAAKKRQASGGLPPVAGGFRYVRTTVDLTGAVGASAGLTEVAITDAALNSFPTEPLTANDSHLPIAVDSSHPDASNYRAFDGTASQALYTTTLSKLDAWVQLDLGSEAFNPIGSEIVVTGTLFENSGYASTYTLKEVAVSNTGAFAGEELVLFTGSTVVQGVAGSLDTTNTINYT